eukprot:CAMPEP_0197661302 /NCGR_PEP_ID=MMETSP1338-20131121/51379_1 /TAXON_ID=43686 ORGANISM="Pelagodinium beii, Strain RCC1491" /NCGR_SAMPLE_ID=MMETSP1338 /ASSEMBLY_ACC=CAM_ASM_000754 /LENGTH=38 /DNA_ID= /DNA_START= /DNA_END= /DNA_ORIENTATION=
MEAEANNAEFLKYDFDHVEQVDGKEPSSTSHAEKQLLA